MSLSFRRVASLRGARRREPSGGATDVVEGRRQRLREQRGRSGRRDDAFPDGGGLQLRPEVRGCRCGAAVWSRGLSIGRDEAANNPRRDARVFRNVFGG